MSNLVVANKSDLVAIADAIRTKAGTSNSLSFPQGFIDAINSIVGENGSNEENIQDTLTWDGNIDGRIVVECNDWMGEYYFVHVSSCVPTVEELKQTGNIKIISIDNEEEYINELQGEDFTEYSSVIYSHVDGLVIATEDNVDYNVCILPKKGIYFRYDSSANYILSFTVPNYNFAEQTVPISFSVDMGGNLGSSSYDAISGMTWSEYVLSEQNTYFSVSEESVYHQPYRMPYILYYDSNFSNNVKPNDDIIDGCTYYAENALST